MRTKIASLVVLGVLFAAAPCPLAAQDFGDEGIAAPAPQARSARGTLRQRGVLEEESPSFDPGPSAGQVAAERSSRIREEFRSAYSAMGRPRVAVFMNRELTSNVHEWDVMWGTSRPTSSTTTQVTRQLGEDGETKAGGSWTRTEQEGGALENVHQGPAYDGTRPSPGGRKDWMWRFEEGFSAPFLSAHCKLVDHATIVRLQAAGSARNGVEYAGVSGKKSEMDALVQHADVILEVLVTEAPGSSHGYAFKATAKEVASGRVLAVVHSEDGGAGTESVIVIGEDGYERATIGPSLDQVIEGLAERVMEGLVAAWS